jgi:hypothetical protein
MVALGSDVRAGVRFKKSLSLSQSPIYRAFQPLFPLLTFHKRFTPGLWKRCETSAPLRARRKCPRTSIYRDFQHWVWKWNVFFKKLFLPTISALRSLGRCHSPVPVPYEHLNSCRFLQLSRSKPRIHYGWCAIAIVPVPPYTAFDLFAGTKLRNNLLPGKEKAEKNILSANIARKLLNFKH